MIRMKLKELIESKGMSMLVLSEKAGVSYMAVCRVCRDKITRIDFSTLNNLCNALGCVPSDIIEYTKDKDDKDEVSVKEEETGE